MFKIFVSPGNPESRKIPVMESDIGTFYFWKQRVTAHGLLAEWFENVLQAQRQTEVMFRAIFNSFSLSLNLRWPSRVKPP